jgi:hypothetical protein
MEAAGGNEVIAKQGTDLIAELRDYLGVWTNPYWVSWDPGEGRAFIQAGDWTPAGGTVQMRWPYYADYVVNLMTYISRNPVPTDLDLMHKIRGMYIEYRSLKSYFYSIMDFAERLGANMNPVFEVLTEIEGKYEESVDAYIDQDYTSAEDMLEASIQDLNDASALAFKLKDQVMLWIFVIEWLTVTATITIAGSVLWTLMIRRRLYEEIESTRFTGS